MSVRQAFSVLQTNPVLRLAAIVTGLALIARVVLFVYLLMYGGEVSFFTGDSLRYLSLADSVLSGNGYQYEGVVESFRAPGYPAYLGLFRLLHIPFWIASFIQILFSAGIAGWTVWFSNKYLGLSFRVATLIGLLVAIEPVQIYYSVLLLPDVFFAVAALAAFTWVLQWGESGTLRYATYAGIAIGVGNFFRPAMLYLPLFLIVGFLAHAWWTSGGARRALTASVVALVAAFAIMSPWYVRNFSTFGHFEFVSAKDYTMYAYVAAATKAVAEDRTYESVKQELLAQAREEAPSPERETFANSDYYTEHANAILKQYPREFLSVYTVGLTAFWTSGNYQYLLKSMGLLDRPSESVSYSMILASEGFGAALSELSGRITEPFILVALFDRAVWFGIFLASLAGLLLYRTNPAAWLTLLFYAYFSATIISTVVGVEARHRYALIPLMIAFAVSALLGLYRFVRTR